MSRFGGDWVFDVRSLCVQTCFASVLTSVLLCIGARGGHGQRNEVESRGLQLVPSELIPQSWPDPKNTLSFFHLFPLLLACSNTARSMGLFPIVCNSGVLGALPNAAGLD